MRRRTFVRTGAALTIGTAGCISPASGPPPRVAQLVLRSETNRDERLEVRMRYAQHNNIPEYSVEVYTLSTDDRRKAVDLDHNAGFYMVTVTAQNRGTEAKLEFSSFDADEFSDDVRMEFVVEADGTIRSTVAELNGST